ncbi:hypothetical protein B0H14DRAFT_3855232 [Mycena olivaceomarginata]|nr:hypothetical protein B0H14DRAFT_3855232 [Mycena olivaceomarginata]
MDVHIKFKRCDHCREVYYCSRSCQTMDRKFGGHREWCNSIRAFRIQDDREFGAKNLTFMRACCRRISSNTVTLQTPVCMMPFTSPICNTPLKEIHQAYL